MIFLFLNKDFFWCIKKLKKNKNKNMLKWYLKKSKFKLINIKNNYV
ncbi:hypothetical protein BTURTLESOX_1201 [bacterium endosymbiont of Bathymodiolus sp. 5 South]|jgi:hypothetical protein|nr:hypothetical protein BTURTLESOX_1201 [bacterium endosymbiont of Bathymodiolus sp. 5 South]VVH63822.1 hypothetical protein BSPWISOX_1009 [uncultured Gammaproteobacteria bacterium]